MRTGSLIAAAVLAVVASPTAVRAYEALQGPTEVRYWDEANAFDG